MRRESDFLRGVLAAVGGAIAAVVVLVGAAIIWLPWRAEDPAPFAEIVPSPASLDTADMTVADAPDGDEPLIGFGSAAEAAAHAARGDAVEADARLAPAPGMYAAALGPAPVNPDGGVVEPTRQGGGQGVLTSRVVRSLAISPTGQPVMAPPGQGGPPSAAATLAIPQASPEPVVPTEPATASEPVEVAAVSQPDAGAAEETPVAPIPLTRPEGLRAAARTDSGDVRVVGGTGVTVRAGPSRSQSRLFALASGARVTVQETRRGWLRIVDEDGRTGWLYQDFVR